MKIAFIGGGNMGEAILSAILEKGISSPWDVSVSDVSENRRHYLEEQYGVAVTDDNRAAADSSDVLLLAVKPQHLPGVMTELRGQLEPAQVRLSIIAGATIQTLSSGLEHNRIVRAMPNTPAQIGEGITVWTATDEVSEPQKEWVSSILGAIGKEIYLADEKYLDMATAVSGSGPAYFFLIVEILVEAAVSIGLPRDTAQELVLQTMIGSGKLIRQAGKSPAELRGMVTSPGGTTAEALLVLENGGFAELITRAVGAAYQKAKELGSERG